ncbi:hypothetical protein DRP04_10245 [Archaeoglobales archaeon]|nr:MAG: hypothetical protein DRP04_10245 [Archaeoglobales archaeon]
MAKDDAVEDYRHDATRKSNPPTGLAAIYEKPERETKKYAYDPHLDPQLVWVGKAGLKCYEIMKLIQTKRALKSMRISAHS